MSMTTTALELACAQNDAPKAIQLLEQGVKIRNSELFPRYWIGTDYGTDPALYYAVNHKMASVVLMLFDRFEWCIYQQHRLTLAAQQAVGYWIDCQKTLKQTVVQCLAEHFSGAAIRKHVGELVNEYCTVDRMGLTWTGWS